MPEPLLLPPPPLRWTFERSTSSPDPVRLIASDRAFFAANRHGVFAGLPCDCGHGLRVFPVHTSLDLPRVEEAIRERVCTSWQDEMIAQLHAAWAAHWDIAVDALFVPVGAADLGLELQA